MQYKVDQQTFPSGRRIRNSSDFELAFRANRLSNKWFVIYVRSNNIGASRLGLVVSKRTTPKAVARNSTKRLIREVFRQHFPTEHPVDLVICAKRQLLPDSSLEYRLALIQLMRAIKPC